MSETSGKSEVVTGGTGNFVNSKLKTKKSLLIVVGLFGLLGISTLLFAGATGLPARGIDTSYTPLYDVLVQPGQFNQALVDSKPDGTKFGLATGAHRLTNNVTLKTGQQLLGFPGASINGSKVLTGWQQSGTTWYIDGQTQRFPEKIASGYNLCPEAEYNMCNKAEDVFIGQTSLVQVDSLAKVAPGKFFFDYGASRIYIGDNPNGVTVETSAATADPAGANQAAALLGYSNNVIKNVTIEKFGNPIQTPALRFQGNAQIINSVIRLNHGQGMMMYGGELRNSIITKNGQLGIGGGVNITDNNELSYNNAEHTDPGFEGGAMKFAYSGSSTMSNNWFHHNYGAGIWYDINNNNALIENNISEDNAFSGLSWEISYKATIRNNIIRNNGNTGYGWYLGRTGIVTTNSRDVEMYNNYISGNYGGGIVAYQDGRIASNSTIGSWELTNLNIHDNTIIMSRATSGNVYYPNPNGQLNGIMVDCNGVPTPCTRYFSGGNNRFANNKYFFPTSVGTGTAAFAWYGASGNNTTTFNFTNWQAQGQDATGTVSTDAPPVPPLLDAANPGGSTSPTPTPTPTPSPTPTPTPTPVTQAPYNSAVSLPGRIEAENYDQGGEGVAFHDLDPANNGGLYRTDAVDVSQSAEGGFKLGWVQQDEWVEYSVTVPTAGTYQFQARVAAVASGASLHAEVDGVNVTGAVAVPVTGSYDTFTTITKDAVNLTAGPHIVRLYIEKAAASGYLGDINWIAFATPAPVQPPAPVTAPTADTIPPVVNLTAPSNGATVKGNVTISTNASDNVALSNLEIYIDGRLYASGQGNTLSTSWNTNGSKVSRGTHTILAKAKDAAGNVSQTSKTVTKY
ncbi:carbohydrate-binding protein [Polaromonas sp.]|nr:carbohydrate-binding protein [Candidatus Saccharibacteria bacterium]